MLRAAVTRVTATLPLPVGNANVSVAAREGVLLQLADRMGRIGQGEASPLHGFSPDTIDACEDALVRLAKAPPPPIDADAPIGPQLRARLDAIASFPPAARFAAETALLDLVGQASRRPLHAILAELAGAPPASTTVPIAALIHHIEPERAIEDAWNAYDRDIRTLKIKIGRPGRFDEELQTLRRLRAELGPDVALRLDANGAFPIREASARLDALAEIGPEIVEEPCAGRLAEVAASMRSHQGGSEPGLVRSRRGASVPLAADESLQLPCCRLDDPVGPDRERRDSAQGTLHQITEPALARPLDAALQERQIRGRLPLEPKPVEDVVQPRR